MKRILITALVLLAFAVTANAETPQKKGQVAPQQKLCGIIPEYSDIFGNKHILSIETQRAILNIMRLNISPRRIFRKKCQTQGKAS